MANNFNNICKFVEKGHGEAWKISFKQLSGFFQELKMTPRTQSISEQSA